MFELEEVNYEDTIPFIPPITHGKVIKVYDGDTITIAALLKDFLFCKMLRTLHNLA